MTTTFRPPRDAREGQAHYEAALHIMKLRRTEDAVAKGDDPHEYAPVLRSEMGALHALTHLDKDGFNVGPDYDLVAEAANLARTGFDVVDGELVRVRKTREADGGEEGATVT